MFQGPYSCSEPLAEVFPVLSITLAERDLKENKFDDKLLWGSVSVPRKQCLKILWDNIHDTDIWSDGLCGKMHG